jgi:hypothetical protein
MSPVIHASSTASYAMSDQRQDLSLPRWSTGLIHGIAYILHSLASLAGKTGLRTREAATKGWRLLQEFPIVQARAKAIEQESEGAFLVQKAKAAAIEQLGAAKANHVNAQAKALDAKSELDRAEAARLNQDIEIRQQTFDAALARRDGSSSHISYADAHVEIEIEGGKPRMPRKEAVKPALTLEVKTADPDDHAAPGSNGSAVTTL